MTVGRLASYFALALAGLAGPARAGGADFVVNSTLDQVDLVPGDGVCLVNPAGKPQCTLRAAVQEANALSGPDRILLGPGTHTLALAPTLAGGAADGDLDILEDLEILGDSAATTTIDAAQLDRLFDVIGAGTSAVLRDLTLTGALSSHPQAGAAIKNQGTLHVADSVVSGNLETNSGGGGIGNFGTLTVERTAIVGNETSGNGGGIANVFGTAEIVDSAISDNDAGFLGGGLSNGSTATLTVLRTDLEGNGVDTPFSVGGGGGIANSGLLVVRDSTLRGNQVAGGTGGGVLNNTGGDATLVNSTLSGNAAPPGGGALLNRELAELRNCTLAGNSAINGGGIQTTSAADTAFTATVLGVNGGGNCFGPAISLFPHHNLDADGSCGFAGSGDQSGVDPVLLPLGDWGGPTQTRMPLHGSPTLDAGDPANGCLDSDGLPLGTDQRGEPRPLDADGDGQAVCDIGAVESNLVFFDGFESGDVSAWSSAIP